MKTLIWKKEEEVVIEKMAVNGNYKDAILEALKKSEELDSQQRFEIHHNNKTYYVFNETMDYDVENIVVESWIEIMWKKQYIVLMQHFYSYCEYYDVQLEYHYSPKLKHLLTDGNFKNYLLANIGSYDLLYDYIFYKGRER